MESTPAQQETDIVKLDLKCSVTLSPSSSCIVTVKCFFVGAIVISNARALIKS